MTDSGDHHQIVTLGTKALSPKICSALQLIPRSHYYLIALSGGLDSIALLRLCVPFLRQRMRYDESVSDARIAVLHVHHGLSPNADKWAAFCAEAANAHGLEFYLEKVEVVPQGQGIEAAARKARYAVFKRYLKNGGVLLQGHHLNDQAETLIMRFMKGLGPQALSGISKERVLGAGLLYRPWLALTRKMLLHEMKIQGADWVEDESNADIRYERNFIRHSIVPVLEQRRPSLLNDLQHGAQRSADYVAFVQQWCESQENHFLSTLYRQYQALDLNQVRSYTGLQQYFVLRYWLDVLGVEHPSESNFQRILDDLLAIDASTKAEVVWGCHSVRVFDNTLFYLNTQYAMAVDYEFVVDMACLSDSDSKLVEFPLPKGRLVISRGRKNETQEDKSVYSIICVFPENVTGFKVRSRHGGDKLYLQNTHATLLKKLYQQYKILPWHRDVLPLIILQDNIIASLAGCVVAPFRLPERDYTAGEPKGAVLQFRYLPHSLDNACDTKS